MSYYPREEQETLYNYDPINDTWKVYSTFPPHIRRILDYSRVTYEYTDHKGRVIAAEGYCDKNQVRLFKPR